MYHQKEHLTSVVILTFVLLLQGCAAAPLPGQVEAIQPGSTLRGVQMAIQGAEGTAIYVKNAMTVFVWPFQGGFGFYATSSDPANPVTLAHITGKGNYVAWNTMRDLTSSLVTHGWRLIAAPVGLSLRQALEIGASAEGFLVIIPAGVFPTEKARVLQ